MLLQTLLSMIYSIIDAYGMMTHCPAYCDDPHQVVLRLCMPALALLLKIYSITDANGMGTSSGVHWNTLNLLTTCMPAFSLLTMLYADKQASRHRQQCACAHLRLCTPTVCVHSP
jgi:hypothetical protein